MLLQVTHHTYYQYHDAVQAAQHLAYLQPRVHAAQTVLQTHLHISPEPSHVQTQQDYFGNPRCYFALQAPHHSLGVLASSTVRSHASAQPVSHQTCQQVRQHLAYRPHSAWDPASEFVFSSPFAATHADFAAYAQPSLADNTPLLEASIGLMQRIHTDFRYQSQSTQIDTPALQALAQRSGVCQDFSHIMIACLRSWGLSARYVSGYLLTQAAPGQPPLLGSDASHAWVSVYLPDLPQGVRWCDFDPTNNRWGWHAPGTDYVTLAVGRDFGDVSPLRGILQGGTRHSLSVAVRVEALAEHAQSGPLTF